MYPFSYGFTGHNPNPLGTDCPYANLQDAHGKGYDCPLSLEDARKCNGFISVPCQSAMAPPSPSPTTTAPTNATLPSIEAGSSSNSHSANNSLVVGITTGVGAAVVVALAAFVAWRRRGRPHNDNNGSDTGSNKPHPYAALTQLERVAKAMSEEDLELPPDIDIFNGLRKRDVDQWHNAFGSFIVALETREQLKQQLAAHGRAWKVRLFEFLNNTLAAIEDFQCVDETTGNAVSFKAKLVALPVTILSSIDLGIFLHPTQLPKIKTRRARRDVYEEEKSEYLDERLIDSLSLIKEACKFGSQTQERSIRGLLVFALLNKVNHALFLSQGSVTRREALLCHVQWARVLQLLRLIYRVVLAPHTRYPFEISSDRGVFLDTRLIKVTSSFLANAALKRMILPESVAMMQREAKTRAHRRLIALRAQRFSAYSELFTGLETFLTEAQAIVDSQRRALLRSRQSQRRLSRALNSFEFEDDTKSESIAAKLRHYKSVNAAVPGTKTSKALLLRSSSTMSVTSSVSKGLVSTHTLIVRLADTLSKDFAAGSVHQVFNALVFSLEKLEKGRNMQALQSLADAALAGRDTNGLGGGGDARSRGQDLQMLLKPQVNELDRQLVAKNIVRSDEDGVYRAKLSGVLVQVKLLKTNFLHPSAKEGLLVHQRLSTSPFMVQLFGIGHSPKNGWFVCMELVERSFEDLIVAWPPVALPRLIHVAIDAASGFAFLHDAGIYHSSIRPGCVLVTNTFQIKIAGFSLSEEMSGGHHTLKTLQSSASSAASRVTTYAAPESHLGFARPVASERKSDSALVSHSSHVHNAARRDVYSLGCVLLELFAQSRQRLVDKLPDDLHAYYYERAENASLLPRLGNSSQHDSSASQTRTQSGSRFVTLRQVSEDGDETQVLGIDVEDFRLPSVVIPCIVAAIALNPERRARMLGLREMLKTALIAAEKQSDEKGIAYLNSAQITEVDKGLLITNLIKGTNNLYKIGLFGVPVAVKVMGSVALVGALHSEVKILQEMCEHEFVVGFLGCGFSDRHGWFLVMEYVQNTLSDMCFNKPLLPLSLRLRISIDMAQGFAHLHAKGVFHRDIKPLNILVTSDFQVRICDFGISQNVGARRVEGKDGKKNVPLAQVTVTHAGLLGTPVYMSPEQHMGGMDLKRLSPIQAQKIDVSARSLVVFCHILPYSAIFCHILLTKPNPTGVRIRCFALRTILWCLSRISATKR